jgi:hypothetical protein
MDAPGTSEFGISPDAPLYVPIWAEAAPPMPPLCEGAGRTAGSVAIAASAFACATDAPGTREFGISPDGFPYSNDRADIPAPSLFCAEVEPINPAATTAVAAANTQNLFAC